MLYVPVVSSTGKPLMPCHPARARELVNKGRALRRFDKGIFYITLLDREDGVLQDVTVGVDPGSKEEGYTVKSKKHTFLNIQAEAVVWVKKVMKSRRILRRARRQRKTPHRKDRQNRSRGGIPPSTKARWGWKLRIINWLKKMFPISIIVVEDIKAWTKKNQRKWNRSFSPLEIGKKHFYQEVEKLGKLIKVQGYQTSKIRKHLELKKLSNKRSINFHAHCVDSWILASVGLGRGKKKPDNKKVLKIVPLMFHRRQLHDQVPKKRGVRRERGGTRSLGFKRGSLVKHPKWGLSYVGGASVRGLSLHSLRTGYRITQSARPGDCKFLAYSSWRFC